MESLRKEIRDEMKRTRLDKGRLYELLLKIVDGGVGGEATQGPAGPQGPAGVCECACTKVEEAPKKKVATTTTSSKKKATTA